MIKGILLTLPMLGILVYFDTQFFLMMFVALSVSLVFLIGVGKIMTALDNKGK